MKILVIAPHPDDELLGVGGTLLKKKDEGNEIGWLIMSKMYEKFGWDRNKIITRKDEIKNVRMGLGISENNLFELDFPTTKLDEYPVSEIVTEVSKIFKEFKPEILFIPHYGDIHSDHRVTFDIVSSCTKWFRHKTIKYIYCYETISETDYNLNPTKHFAPNYFVDISNYINQKIDLCSIYHSEISSAPFPRSFDVIKALSIYRGSQSGFKFAEAFTLLKGIEL